MDFSKLFGKNRDPDDFQDLQLRDRQLPDFTAEREAISKMSLEDWDKIPEPNDGVSRTDEVNGEDEIWQSLRVGTSQKRRRDPEMNTSIEMEKKRHKPDPETNDLLEANIFPEAKAKAKESEWEPISCQWTQCTFPQELLTSRVRRGLVASNFEYKEEDGQVIVQISGDIAPRSIARRLKLEMQASFFFEEWHPRLRNVKIDLSKYIPSATLEQLEKSTYTPVFDAISLELSQEEESLLLQHYGPAARFQTLSPALKPLRDRIHALLQPNTYYFPRLSFGSPTDICLEGDDFELVQCDDADGVLQCILASKKIRNFVKNSRLVSSMVPGPKLNCSIHLLSFQDISKKSEYLCFVYDEKLTAISQKWPNEHLKLNDADKKHTLELIKDFVSILLKELSYSNCVLNVCILQGKPAYLIDVAGFNFPTTKSGLFDWKNDSKILRDSGDVTFRVNSSAPGRF